MYNRIYLDNPFAADLWSAACTIIYIAIGYVPVESFGVNLLSEWLTILRETLPSEWITALPKYDQGYFINPDYAPSSQTLDSLIEDSYPYPDRQDFVNFLHLILVVRPEKRGDIPCSFAKSGCSSFQDLYSAVWQPEGLLLHMPAQWQIIIT